jgi:cytidylate kinase
MSLQGLDEETARRALPKADHAHESYAKHFYNVNIHDPRLFHLMIDTTAIPVEECVEVIVTAARSLREPVSS